MTIALFGKKFDDDFKPYMSQMFKVLTANGATIKVFHLFHDFLLKSCRLQLPAYEVFDGVLQVADADVAFSIGGDGTFLETVTYVHHSRIPVLGINSGRLGFLADTAGHDIEKSLSALFKGDYQLRYLDLLRMQASVPIQGVDFALNEFAITKRDSSSMITIHTYVNNEFLNSYWADGLMVATPTGSTAYSLSVGGPILHPGSPNFVITPIAPHNLNVRPLVVPNNVVIDLKIEGRGKKILASLDSRNHVFNTNCSFRIERADFRIGVVQFPNHSFYSTLRNKLMWGADKRNW